MIITYEDNNENANEQIGDMITWESILESFVCQNGHYKLTCQCKKKHFICFYAIAKQ